MKALMSFIPMIFSLAIATFIFIPINKSLKLSDKISKIIPILIKEELKMKALMSFIPMIFSLAIATFIFIPINKSLKLSDKISKIIPTTPKFKPLFFVVCMFLLLLIIGLLGLYVIPMNDLTYYILTGIIAGIGISITVEISPKHHK